MDDNPNKWQKGVHPEYRCFDLTVRIAQDNDGNVFSTHDFAGGADAQTATSLPSHGLEQIVLGLLTETLRREAYLETMILCAEHDDYIEKLVEFPEAHQKRKDQITGTVCRQMTQLIQKLAPEAVEGVLEMIMSQSNPDDTVSQDET